MENNLMEEIEFLFKINDEVITLLLPADGSNHIFQVTSECRLWYRLSKLYIFFKLKPQ